MMELRESRMRTPSHAPRDCCDFCCYFHSSCYSTHFIYFCALLVAVFYAIAALAAIACAFAIVPVFFSLAGGLLLLAALAWLYAHGADLGSDSMMLPYLVAELLLKVFFGLCVCGLWIAYILSLYEQINDFTMEYGILPRDFCALGSASTLAFALSLRAFFFFHTGYRTVKKLNDCRRMCANDASNYMTVVGVARRRAFTGAPTAV